jgi:uncharacterized protein YtpQ (UPF0354 family)
MPNGMFAYKEEREELRKKDEEKATATLLMLKEKVKEQVREEEVKGAAALKETIYNPDLGLSTAKEKAKEREAAPPLKRDKKIAAHLEKLRKSKK